MTLRPYQERAVAAVRECWARGARRVLLACPTGGGKTACMARLVADSPTIWVAHRRELLQQAAERLRGEFGHDHVGVAAPGFPREPGARIQVSTVQTLLARDWRPAADLLVWDEAHHAPADAFAAVAASYDGARHLGATATPCRQDGRPLGDCYDALVVGAQYSELLRDRHLVSCRVFQPPEVLGGDLAQEPLAAYQRIAAGERAFLFVSGVRYAEQQAAAFCAAGVPAAAVHAGPPTGRRDEALRRFRAGDLRVLANCAIFTEGTDVPEASTIILARACQHVGLYLQIVGRALRPSPGKDRATLIDLTGASVRHGLPTQDREYSLTGEPISEGEGAALRVCQKCGLTFASAPPCPACGYAPPKEAPPPPRIWSLELREVYAGVDTPPEAMVREWARLRALAASKGWSLAWAARQYKKLFSEPPPLADSERRAIYAADAAFAASKGWRPGWAKHRYRELCGAWPARPGVGA